MTLSELFRTICGMVCRTTHETIAGKADGRTAGDSFRMASGSDVTDVTETCGQDRMEFQGLQGVGYGLVYQERMTRKLFSFCMASVLLLVICVVALVVLALDEKTPVYFGVNQEMQIIPMYPLHEPMYTDAALKSWAAQAAREIFNMDFLNWPEQLGNARRFFTNRAYLSFVRSLKEEGHIRILSRYRALMHGILQGTPVIVAAGVLQNRMTWEVDVPFLLAYETSEKVLSDQSFVIRMRIRRVSTAEYVQGIAISQLIVSRAGRSREGQKDGQ